MNSRAILCLAVLLWGTSLTVAAADYPRAMGVSPGGVEAPTRLGEPCPTFSWGAVPEASGYELAVFWSPVETDTAFNVQTEQGEPVLEARIAAPALSWTPAGDACLDEGGTYLWFVRAVSDGGPGPWSVARRFEVDLAGGTLAEAVRREVSTQLKDPDTWNRVVREALGSGSDIVLRRPLIAASGPGTTGSADAAAGVAASGQPAEGRAPATKASFPYSRAFRVSSDDGVVFDAPGGLNTRIPAEGAGGRFMWYPGKRALRAGEAGVSKWNNNSIGNYSIALGYDNIASRDHSIALGNQAGALSHDSVAIGQFATAGDSSDPGNTFNAVAIGYSAWARNKHSVAIGFDATARGAYSTAIGYETIAHSAYETVVGRGNIDGGGSTSGWFGDERLFVVGNGPPNGSRSDALVILKNGNTGIGTSAPQVPLQIDGGSDCTIPGDESGYLVVNGTDTTNLCIDNNEIQARNNGAVSNLRLNSDGGTTTVGGTLELLSMGTAGGSELCRNGNIVSLCTSSSARYKESIETLPLGLDAVERLRPVTFKWRDREERDLGFVAEEVAAIDPLLATYNDDGEIEGVKYRQLTAVLVNAVQEQQRQIARLNREIAGLRQAMGGRIDLADDAPGAGEPLSLASRGAGTPAP